MLLLRDPRSPVDHQRARRRSPLRPQSRV